MTRLGLLLVGAFLSLPASAAEKVQPPPPPKQVKAHRQDFQAARITWKAPAKNLNYRLYASLDREPPEFHQENGGMPITAEFVIWDAPRTPLRRFAFYVTSIDRNGVESKPSKKVTVDLGPLP